ncbi:MAG: hypothetical protein AAGM22_08690 [Acidobacteriota bacterium]
MVHRNDSARAVARSVAALFFLIFLLGAPGQRLDAAPTADGAQFQVNTTATGSQSSPQVAHAPDGSFLVAWTSSSSPGTDTDSTSVVGQRFSADGAPDGAEFQINSLTSGEQNLGDLEILPNGNVVAVWSGDETTGPDPDRSIQGKILFAAGGESGDFQVNTLGSGLQSSPRGDSDAAGNFVVTWLDSALNGQLFSSDGTYLGTEIQINVAAGNSIVKQDVGVLPDGRFAIFWMEWLANGDVEVWGLRFAPDGSDVLDSRFRVDVMSEAAPEDLRVAVEDGDYHVAWVNTSLVFPGSPVKARSLGGSDLTPLYDTVELDQFFSLSRQVAIDAEKGGGIVVAWNRDEDNFGGGSPDGSKGAVFARALRSDGTVTGDEFIVNTVTAGNQRGPALSFDDLGRLIVVWDSESSAGADSDVSSIQAQAFASGDIIFADGFESGDLSRWIEFP